MDKDCYTEILDVATLLYKFRVTVISCVLTGVDTWKGKDTVETMRYFPIAERRCTHWYDICTSLAT